MKKQIANLQKHLGRMLVDAHYLSIEEWVGRDLMDYDAWLNNK